MKDSINAQDILLWEKFRFMFNGMMILSGIVIFIIVNTIKPINLNMHNGYGFTYMEMILGYGIFANIIYTLGYIFISFLQHKMLNNQNQDQIENHAKRFFIFGGVFLNICAGMMELVYRFTSI